MSARKKKLHPDPGPNASNRKRVQVRLINPLINAMNENAISHEDIATALNVHTFSISQYFLKAENQFKLPAIDSFLSIYDWLESPKQGFYSTNQSGRVFNYPEVFEGSKLTRYERELIAENNRLRSRIAELEKQQEGG